MALAYALTKSHFRIESVNLGQWLFFLNLKIPIWVYFGRPWNGKCWYALWLFGIPTMLSFGRLPPPILVCFTIKIWQPWVSVSGLGELLKD
jgi:hypothetical protein